MSEVSEYKEELDRLADEVEKAVVRSVHDEDAVGGSIERLAGVRDSIAALKGLLKTVVDATDELKEAIAKEEQESRETSGEITAHAHEAEELMKLALATLEGTDNEHADTARNSLSAAHDDASEAGYGYEQGHQGAEWLLTLADGLRQAFDTADGIIIKLEERTSETAEQFDNAKTSVENEVIGNQTALQELQTYQEGL
jgi:hypothetical protein